MPVWLSDNESQRMHASSYLSRFPKLVSGKHTQSHSGSLAAACPTVYPGCSILLAPVQNSFLSVKSCLSLTLCMPQSVPPVLSLLPCAPSSGAPYVRVLVVQCRMWWEGGRQAGLKRGAQLFPHTASTPHWSVAHLTIWGRQSKGRREMDLGTLCQNNHTLLLEW